MWQPSTGRLRDMSPRVAWLMLGAIPIFGLALRVWYLSADLNLLGYWDERYSLENVTAILETGSLEPIRGFVLHPVVEPREREVVE
ncbi:MAG: hypothetical protein VYE73_09330 [Acidobacteriota bacterium]|nr:hypothetical protein [Acidobacteriota bacterium]